MTSAKIRRFGHLFQVVDPTNNDTILIDDLCGYMTRTPAFQIETYFQYVGLIQPATPASTTESVVSTDTPEIGPCMVSPCLPNNVVLEA